MPQEITVPSGPSLEINLSEIERIATELDREAAADTTVGGRRKKRAGKKGATPQAAPAGTADNPEVIPAAETTTEPPKWDPEFEAMIVHGTSQGIDWMKDAMDLIEPGDTLRENVGKCVSKLVQRLKPMQAGPIADCVTIAGYLSVWVLCGRKAKPKPEPEGSPHN
jgi:hypothetical protein